MAQSRLRVRVAHRGAARDEGWRPPALAARLGSESNLTRKLCPRDLELAIFKIVFEEANPQENLVHWWLQQQLRDSTISLEDVRAAAEASEEIEVKMVLTGGKKMRATVFALRAVANIPACKDDPSSENEIDPELTDVAAAFITKGGWPEAESSAHDRFEIAFWLKGLIQKGQSEPEATKSHITFGRTLAMVNLLIGKHSVLGKRLGRLVPYAYSEEYEKQENARRCVPSGLRDGEKWVSTWSELLKHVRLLCSENAGRFYPSRLKLTFREMFQLELSETALGYTNLMSLLGDERMSAEFDLVKPTDGKEAYLELKKEKLPLHHRAKFGKGERVTKPEVSRAGALPLMELVRPAKGRKDLPHGEGPPVTPRLAKKAAKEQTPPKHWQKFQPNLLKSVAAKDTKEAMALQAAAVSAAVAVMRFPFSELPPWCTVRRTFIETQEAEPVSQSRRAHSMPPLNSELEHATFCVI